MVRQQQEHRQPSAIDAVSPASAVSSITAPSPAPQFPPPKMKQIRRTTQGAQPYSHPMAPSINQKQLHNNQIGNGNVWRRGMTGRDHSTKRGRGMAKSPFSLPLCVNNCTRPMALDDPTSSNVTFHQSKTITQQSNRQWERVAPGDDGQGSFICPTRPIMHEFRFAKLAERGGRYCIATSKNETQSTWWFEFAQGMHGLGGTHPSGNVRACEPRHPQFLQ